MGTKRKRRHARDNALTGAQELELVIGEGDPRAGWLSEFPSDAVRRQEYFKHRAWLLERNICGCWATDRYEGGSPPLALTAAGRREKAISGPREIR